VTGITARIHDKKVIFTACSDAPHMSSLRKKVDAPSNMLSRW
jgi:hypothetical protein